MQPNLTFEKKISHKNLKKINVTKTLETIVVLMVNIEVLHTVYVK